MARAAFVMDRAMRAIDLPGKAFVPLIVDFGCNVPAIMETLAGMLDLSQETMRLVRSNFRVAVGVNSAILLGAVTGRFAPLPTAVLHNGTTIAVLLHSMLAARSFGGVTRWDAGGSSPPVG